MRAKGRPFGTASVTMEMTPRDGGTEVTITENPDGVFRPARLPARRCRSARLGRNAESLMRMEELALRKARQAMKRASFWVDTDRSAAAAAASSTARSTTDVAILGGGIVGITLATLLEEAGVRVVLLEADQLAPRRVRATRRPRSPPSTG